MKSDKKVRAKPSKEKKIVSSVEQRLKKKIIDLTKAQQELRDSESRYRSMIENMELGIMEVNNEEVIIKAYPIFCKMVGYKENELVGKKAKKVKNSSI